MATSPTSEAGGCCKRGANGFVRLEGNSKGSRGANHAQQVPWAPHRGQPRPAALHRERGSWRGGTGHCSQICSRLDSRGGGEARIRDTHREGDGHSQAVPRTQQAAPGARPVTAAPVSRSGLLEGPGVPVQRGAAAGHTAQPEEPAAPGALEPGPPVGAGTLATFRPEPAAGAQLTPAAQTCAPCLCGATQAGHGVRGESQGRAAGRNSSKEAGRGKRFFSPNTCLFHPAAVSEPDPGRTGKTGWDTAKRAGNR